MFSSLLNRKKSTYTNNEVYNNDDLQKITENIAQHITDGASYSSSLLLTVECDFTPFLRLPNVLTNIIIDYLRKSYILTVNLVWIADYTHSLIIQNDNEFAKISIEYHDTIYGLKVRHIGIYNDIRKCRYFSYDSFLECNFRQNIFGKFHSCDVCECYTSYDYRIIAKNITLLCKRMDNHYFHAVNY